MFNGDIAEHCFDEVLRLAHNRNLVSSEHFTVDGSLIQAWAGQKSFQPKTSSDGDQENPPPTCGGSGNGRKGRNEASDFRKQTRCNETHQSTTDPDARLFKESGDGAKLVYMAHLLTENRNGLVVNARISHATGKAETEAALEMVSEVQRTNRITLGADQETSCRSSASFLPLRTPPRIKRAGAAISTEEPQSMPDISKARRRESASKRFLDG